MNQAEKEAYLREYSILKNEGKPFFPYAVAKDALDGGDRDGRDHLPGAGCSAPSWGRKVDPTTTTYVPRPDWYFFFLFEVLRVMKNVPKFTPMATIGVPTICMILLFLLPFYDRSPERRIERRPIALCAGVATIAAMAFLTYSGANTGSPNSVDAEAAAVAVRRSRPRPSAPASCRRAVRLPRLPRDRRQRQQRAGTGADPHRLDAAGGRDRLDAAQPDRADAVVQEPGPAVAAEVPEPGRRSCRCCSSRHLGRWRRP